MRYSEACVGCSAEDCPCCEVYLEHRADQQYAYEHPEDRFAIDYDEEGVWEEDEEGEWEEVDDSMDGDFDSAMESAGWGTDEDYNHWECDYEE